MNEGLRLGIFVSGGGSTMEHIVKAARPGGELSGKITPAVVISNRPDAPGLAKADALDIPTATVRRQEYEKGKSGSEQFGRAIMEILRRYAADYVSQNGWLVRTPDIILYAYDKRIFNQHPGPLDPEHTGRDGTPLHFGGQGMHGRAVHAAVLEFQRLSGRVFPTEATVHRVDTDFDSGAVTARQEVPVIPSDTPESLAVRVLPAEHQLQVAFWSGVADGGVDELLRTEPLVRPGEDELLRQAVIYARETYPNG